jgi:hypothetical protein
MLVGFPASLMFFVAMGRLRGIRTDFVFRLDFLLVLIFCSLLGALACLPVGRRWPALALALSPVATTAIVFCLAILMHLAFD